MNKLLIILFLFSTAYGQGGRIVFKSYVDSADGIRLLKSDTSTFLSAYQTGLNNRLSTTANALNQKYTDSSTMLSAYRTALLARSLTSHTHAFSAITGSVADAQLSSNVALKNIDNSFSVGQHIGNLGLATSGNDAYLDNSGGGDVIFRTSGSFSERARITNTGQLVLTDARIGSGVAASDASITFGLVSGNPFSALKRSGSGTNEKIWDTYAGSTSLNFRAVSDDLTGASGWLTVNRSGTTITGLQFPSYGAGYATFDASGNITSTSSATLNAANVKYTDTSSMLSAYQTGINSKTPLTTSALKVNYTDTTTMLANYQSGLLNRALLNATNTFVIGQIIAPTAADAVTGLLVNKNNASATGNILDLQLAGASKLNVTTAGVLTTAGAITAGGTLTAGGGIFSTFSNSSQANLYVTAGTSAVTNTTAQNLLTGWTGVTSRIIERGTSTPTVTVNDAYVSHMIGTETFTEAASGTHPLVSALVVRNITGTNAGAATTDGATVYIEGSMTGVTATGLNDALRVKTGTTRLQGGLVLNQTNVADLAYTLLATDYRVSYTTLTATRAVTLPTAASVSGQSFVIKDQAGTANTNNITIVGTVNGASNPTAINTAYGVYRFYSNGTAFFTE